MRLAHLYTATATLLLALSASAGQGQPGQPQPTRRIVLQPVEEYFNISEVAPKKVFGLEVLNGFLTYTHLGSDFGFVGPGSLLCNCEPHCICAELLSTPNGWAGVWHSLNGLARENRPLDLRAAYPALIAPAYQPRVVGFQAIATGTGKLKLELRSSLALGNALPLEQSLWAQTFDLNGTQNAQTFQAIIDPAKIPQAQYLNWIAEPGASLCVDSLALQIELPPVDFPTYVFLASYAKLARCYSERTGLVRDRAHTTVDSFNNVPSTGMFALATAAAHRAGIVEEAPARETVRKIFETIRILPRERGLLPHFVYQKDGRWLPLKSSEYSTIDTALCLISLRIAATVLNDPETAAGVLRLMQEIQMDSLRNAEGYVLHGIRDDGQPLMGIWRDWGGETALVLMVQRIAAGPTFIPKMDDLGKTHRGVGFIAELPALFFPKFNSNARAHAGKVDWRAYRQQRFSQQKAYFPTYQPQSVAAQLGLYGLSAGEGSLGRSYHVSGVDDADQKLIYPHYILMSSLLEPDPQPVYALLGKMEAHGWLPPWGLVENIEADGKTYLPMISSLNAAFEALASYHLLMAQRKAPDAIYQAAQADPIFEDALNAIFE